MSIHAYHPPEQAHLILKDDCPRCREHADEPWFTLDEENLTRLVDMALAWEDGEPGRWPETEAERIACQRILNVLNAMRACFGLPSRAKLVGMLRG